AELVAQNLGSRGQVRIAVANRSPARARALAERFDGSAVAFEGLAAAVTESDVVVSSTLSEGYLIGPADVPPGRRGLVGLARPRDIDRAVAEVDGVTLVNLDDLEETVLRNIGLRQVEAEQAYAIVGEQADRFRSWLAALEVVPAITELRARAEQVRRAEL